MIIAIDGPAGSGKSTVAKEVARRLGIHYLDTGALYRTVAWAALEHGLSLDDERAVASLAGEVDVRFVHDQESTVPTRVLALGNDVTAAIRTPHVDEAVSAVARMPDVRKALIPAQRKMAAAGDLVAEGRDIGTVVFPDAEVKIFLTASEEERARRRHVELIARGENVDAMSVREGMARRDYADSTRATAPLTHAADAVEMDTTGLDIDSVIEQIVTIVRVAHGD